MADLPDLSVRSLFACGTVGPAHEQHFLPKLGPLFLIERLDFYAFFLYAISTPGSPDFFALLTI